MTQRIVLNDGRPLCIGSDKILYVSGGNHAPVALFKSYQEAYNALRRTIHDRNRMGLFADTCSFASRSKYKIMTAAKA